MSDRPRVVLGVAGGIAAYKACEVLRLLSESGHEVTVVPTESALRFVGEATWAALSGRPVATAVFDDVHEVPHVAIGRRADVVLVVPATADLMARAVAGRADDLLTATLLTATCPVVFVPAMHTEMWEHPATVDNVATLRRRGSVVMEPASGRLTGSDTGKGRLPDPSQIADFARALLAGRSTQRDLVGVRVTVTAGGTREPLDPVRYIGNRSSGKQGYALASAALARGASVTVIAANVGLPDVAGATTVHVETTAQLREATVTAAPESDVIVMAAAPSDFRPLVYAERKIKKNSDGIAPSLDLELNPDIAAELGASKRPGQILVTFAAETHDGLEHARRKHDRKRADLSVLNEVGDGKAFGTDDNAVVILRSDGSMVPVELARKSVVADRVWDEVVGLRHGA